MEQIISPVSRKLIKQELTKERFLRETTNGGNLLYMITAHNAPHTMQEIGRLRELTFRSAGGGTGKAIDIDPYDTNDNPYKQLIVWDPAEEEILGGYRWHLVDPKKGEELHLSTTSLFHFSDKFKEEYLPSLIELGRSFVQPKYQSANRKGKGLFALDNLWDGLGALVVTNPGVKYFFGKVTMYRSYNRQARNLLLYFMEKYFHDDDGLVTPIYPLELDIDREQLQKVFIGKDYKEDYSILTHRIKELGEHIPPLINSYMNISPSMKVLGTVINPHFGNVEETGIMVTISDIYENKVERYIFSFFRRRFKNLRQR